MFVCLLIIKTLTHQDVYVVNMRSCNLVTILIITANHTYHISIYNNYVKSHLGRQYWSMLHMSRQNRQYSVSVCDRVPCGLVGGTALAMSK